MLEQDDADRLLGLCQEQIESYANPETPVGDGDLELLAESLSGLGFFVEALEQQRSDRQRLIAPLLAKRLGEAPVAEPDADAETVEDAVEDLRGLLPQLVAEIRRAPADAAARAVLTAKLRDLVDDATLIDDCRAGPRRRSKRWRSSTRWRRSTAAAPSRSRPRSPLSPRAARRSRTCSGAVG